MNIGKISSTLKSPYTHLDALGRQIHINDIVDVALNNYRHNICVVEKFSDRFIYCLDKKSLDKGFIEHVGRGIVPEQCLVISDLFASDIQKNVETNTADTLNKYKEEKKKAAKNAEKYYICFYYKDKDNYGIIINTTIGTTKQNFIESYKKLCEKYPEYKFYPHSANGFAVIDDITKIQMDNSVKLFSENSHIFNHYFYNSPLYKCSITGLLINIELNNTKNKYKFIIDKECHKLISASDYSYIMHQWNRYDNDYDLAGMELPVNYHDNDYSAVIFTYGSYYTYDEFKKHLDKILSQVN